MVWPKKVVIGCHFWLLGQGADALDTGRKDSKQADFELNGMKPRDLRMCR